jgi:hypothetical protein
MCSPQRNCGPPGGDRSRFSRWWSAFASLASRGKPPQLGPGCQDPQGKSPVPVPTVSVSTIYHGLVGITNLSVDLVSDGDLDRFESIQNVELQSVREF